MVHRIQAIETRDNYLLEATFFSGEVKQFDMVPLFAEIPQFQAFKNVEGLFEKVVVDQGGYGVSWNDELDLDAETIWDGGILIEVQRKPSIKHLLAYRLLLAREQARITQKELADKTGIYQADISKIERGLGNPSLSTLERLADGLDMDLTIDFIYKQK